MRRQAAAIVQIVAAVRTALRTLEISIVGIQRTPVLQRLKQPLQVLLGQAGIELLAAHAFGEQFGDVALVVGLHLAKALRLASVRFTGMHIGVVVDLHERLEHHAEALAVIEHGVMMIGNAPGAGIDVLALVEAALLAKTAQLRVLIAAAQRPAAPARNRIVFEHLHAVAGVAQLERRDQARDTGAQDQHGGALRRALQFYRPAVIRFLGKAKAAHGLIHCRAASNLADECQQITTTQDASLFWHTVFLTLLLPNRSAG